MKLLAQVMPKYKCIKSWTGKVSLVMHRDIGMEMMVELRKRGLVRKFMYHNFGKREPMDWMERPCNKFINYV